MVGPNTFVYCWVAMTGMERADATEVMYWAVEMIVSELCMSGLNLSWMSQRKKVVVLGASFPTLRVILDTAAVDADMLRCVCLF